MPTKRGVRVVLLVEDEALECFVRRVLLAFGFQTRDIRVERSPKGKGPRRIGSRGITPKKSGSIEARSGYQANIGLVVGTDADERTREERG